MFPEQLDFQSWRLVSGTAELSFQSWKLASGTSDFFSELKVGFCWHIWTFFFMAGFWHSFLFRAESWFAPSASVGKVTGIQAAWKEDVVRIHNFLSKVRNHNSRFSKIRILIFWNSTFPEQSYLESFKPWQVVAVLGVGWCWRHKKHRLCLYQKIRGRILQEFRAKNSEM